MRAGGAHAFIRANDERDALRVVAAIRCAAACCFSNSAFMVQTSEMAQEQENAPRKHSTCRTSRQVVSAPDVIQDLQIPMPHLHALRNAADAPDIPSYGGSATIFHAMRRAALREKTARWRARVRAQTYCGV